MLLQFSQTSHLLIAFVDIFEVKLFCQHYLSMFYQRISLCSLFSLCTYLIYFVWEKIADHIYRCKSENCSLRTRQGCGTSIFLLYIDCYLIIINSLVYIQQEILVFISAVLLLCLIHSTLKIINDVFYCRQQLLRLRLYSK